MLCRQSVQDFEVIVCDDGSKGGAAVVERFAHRLRLNYDWRPNDHCVSRSRNRGVKKASGDYVVLVDGDILLNPEALQAFQSYAQATEPTLTAAYMGNDLCHWGPSLWLPERQVNYLDLRVQVFPKILKLRPAYSSTPMNYAWSAIMGLSRELYESVGGFDERFWGWGGEDPQFSLDVALKGAQMSFSFEAWGEHQIHPRSGSFHMQVKKGKRFEPKLFQQLTFAPPQLRSKECAKLLADHIFKHYYPQDKTITETMRWQAEVCQTELFSEGLLPHEIKGTQL